MNGFQPEGSGIPAEPALRLSPFITHPTPQALLGASHPSPGRVVSGIPKPEVTWFLDGVPVRSREGSIEVYEAGGTHYLCLWRARARDSGSYSCTATNVRGQVSCCWTLLVKSEYVPQGHLASLWEDLRGVLHTGTGVISCSPLPRGYHPREHHSCLLAKVKVIAPRE